MRCPKCVEESPVCGGEIHPDLCLFDRATIHAKSIYWSERAGHETRRDDRPMVDPPREPGACCPAAPRGRLHESPPMDCPIGTMVRVHWGRIERHWIIRDHATDAAYSPQHVLALEDVEFDCDHAQRVLARSEGGSAVYAWAVGKIAEGSLPLGAVLERVYFTPTSESPFTRESGGPAHSCLFAEFDEDGRARISQETEYLY